MNKKLLILLAALLCSCGDEGVLDNEHSQDAKLKLYVTLTDFSDGNPIPNASLSIQSTGKTAKTAENGKVLFEDISAGNHTLRIEADGYATAIVTSSVSEITRAGEGSKATQVSYTLYPKTATLEGYVQHTGSDGQVKALTGLPVRVAFNCASLAETMTEPVLTEEGKFSIQNLPAIDGACTYSIQTTGETIDGQTFNAMTFTATLPSLKKGSKAIIASPMDVGSGVGLFTVVSYSREIEYGKEDTPIVFTFSENIAANQQGKITAPDASVAGCNVKIEGNAITLAPVSKWSVGSNFTVTFTNLKSESGKTFTSSFTVETLLKDISGLKVEGLQLAPGTAILYSSNTASIIFKKVDGATGYYCYLEENGKVSKAATAITQPVSNGATTVTATCNIALSDSNAVKKARVGDNTNKIIVQAFNSRYESQKAELEVKETKPVAPVLATTTVYAPLIEKGKILDPYGVSGIGDYAALYSGILDEALEVATASAKEYNGYIYFSRAMNTTVAPTFAATDCASIAAATIDVCGRLNITYEWLNEQALSVKVQVKAGTAAVAGNVWGANITIKGLTGKNNIAFDNGTTPPTTGNANLVLKMVQRRLFFENFEISNPFTIKSNSGNNKWIRGTDAGSTSGGDYSAYISNNGSSYDYNNGLSSSTYMFKKVKFSSLNYKISFQWKAAAENNYDYMMVCLIPEANFDENNISCSKYNLTYNISKGIGANNNYWSSGSGYPWQESVIEGTIAASGDFYLIFSWQNDGDYSTKPIAIDDIIVEQN